MPNFISLILSEITDKLNCKLINAYYFNLKLNVYSNPLSFIIYIKYIFPRENDKYDIPDLHVLHTK